MYRTRLADLEKWFSTDPRKPLVIRGARQVGKTWLVRHFAELKGLTLIEINLEQQRGIAEYFESNKPHEIVRELSAHFGIVIQPETSLLFLDEIQAVPELYAKLRWFFEEMPELPVIATGSLLEFALRSKKMSMPVGRVSYLFLEPFSFIEFLLAKGKEVLVSYIQTFTWESKISQVLHDDLMSLFKEYLIVGGLPRAVKNWITHGTMESLSAVQEELLRSYQEDFYKYGGISDYDNLNDVLDAVPKYLGKKFVFSRVNPDVRAYVLKKALKLLTQARVCHIVYRTSASGLPLKVETQRKFFKVILIDVGLCSAALDYSLLHLKKAEDVELINHGGIAEQVVGQLLRTLGPYYHDPGLYYWIRPEKESSAEIDYVVQHKGLMVPIEVKAGTAGVLRSLHAFMQDKKLDLAARINSALPRRSNVSVKDSKGDLIEYELRSLPFYLMSELQRLLS